MNLIWTGFFNEKAPFYYVRKENPQTDLLSNLSMQNSLQNFKGKS